jgi:hypothetical protein
LGFGHGLWLVAFALFWVGYWGLMGGLLLYIIYVAGYQLVM